MKVIYPELVPPEWLMITLIMIFFTWGFSEKQEVEVTDSSES